MTDVRVVAPQNIGKGIVWDEVTKTYQVKLGKGLYFDRNGTIQMQSNEPVVKSFDNGTGNVYHKQAIIDFGGLIKVSGVLTLPLLDISFVDLRYEDPRLVEERQRLSQVYPNTISTQTIRADSVSLGLTTSSSNYPTYYTEAWGYIDLTEFNPKQIISASATAGDINGFRKETAWIVNNMDIPEDKRIPVGVHVYYSEGQTEVKVSYSIEFTKA